MQAGQCVEISYGAKMAAEVLLVFGCIWFAWWLVHIGAVWGLETLLYPPHVHSFALPLHYEGGLIMNQSVWPSQTASEEPFGLKNLTSDHNMISLWALFAPVGLQHLTGASISSCVQVLTGFHHETLWFLKVSMKRWLRRDEYWILLADRLERLSRCTLVSSIYRLMMGTSLYFDISHTAVFSGCFLFGSKRW